MRLIIVESPGKIKKISSILPKEYLIKASVGHIRDLDKKGLSYDETTFVPEYKILSDKHEVVNNLKDAAKKATIIYLASDPDREGEAISQGLKDILKLKEYKRITFNSITATAIKDAIDNPRQIDDQLVEAQETRRILDRMLGYKISPLLMKKIGMSALSAGRVQSVVVRIMVDLENEITNFKPESDFGGHAETSINGKKFGLSIYYKNKLFHGDEDEARNILEKLKNSKYTLSELTEKTREQNPPPPFITSTLQQEASNKLKYDLQRTMKNAQVLYEAGKITYMRTDSPSISKEAIEPIKDVIKDKFTEASYKYREYKSKNASAQEAHECIRPTHPEVDTDDPLYNMIWKRTIASLMQPAIYQVFQVTVKTDDPDIILKGEVDRLESPGFLQVYGQSADESITLSGDKKVLKVTNICMEEKITSPPGRYGEASLVKDLEKLEIGRPSTYAALITKIKDRGYIEEKDHDGIVVEQKILKLNKTGISEETDDITLGKEKKRLTPTLLGLNITKILIEMFPNFMDVGFTAKTEAVLDEIASGTKKKLPVLTEYWNILKNYLDKLSTMVIVKEAIPVLGEYDSGKIYLVTTRYGDAIKYEKGKDITYVSVDNKDLTIEDAIEKLKEKIESGVLIGEVGKAKYYKTTAKFGPVIKRVMNGKAEYRSIKDVDEDKEVIDMDLAKKLFSYPIVLSKTVSLNYNHTKDSYYLKEGTKFLSFPKENLDDSKEEILSYWMEKKDTIKAKAKFIKYSKK